MSIGQRIQLGRRIAGMNQRTLAGKVGVSATAISKYERDQDTPRSPVLLRLAEALDVGIEFFLRPPIVKQIVPAFPSSSNSPMKGEATILGRIQEWLERYVEAEYLLAEEGYGLENRFQWPESFPYTVRSLPEVETAAHLLRDAWQLGQDPIDNLTEILEDRGIKVGLFDGYAQFDACTFWVCTAEEVPVIAASVSLPGDRQRLSLARELGRLVLRIPEDRDGSLAQVAALRFGGALLVPAEAARFELGEQRRMISTYELHLLKHKYGISMWAWLCRAWELGILPDDNAAPLLFSSLEMNREIGREPGDALPREEPTRLERIVMRALCEELISERRASELLGKPFRQFAKEVAEGHDGLEVVVCGRY
jgi:transcriptional regulator with XRE-family HTH domain